MKMKYRHMVLTALAVGFVMSPALADVSMTMHSTMQSPMMDKAMASMGPGQKKMMDDMMNSRIYMSGKRYRMDNGLTTTIIDAGAKTMTMINTVKHTYCVTPVTEAAMNGVMGQAGIHMPTDSAHMKVVDTGKTTQIRGHKCRHYIVTMTMFMPSGGSMTMRSDILAAQDMPGVDSSIYGALNMQMGAGGAKVKGVPLETITKTSGGVVGDMTITQTATDISTTAIPRIMFTVPAGYKKLAQSAFLSSLMSTAMQMQKLQ